jgi:anti-sigma regulatory factor (Ser/Thr protein kinase)
MSEKEIGKIKIAVYEACLNVIEHAYHSGRMNGSI